MKIVIFNQKKLKIIILFQECMLMINVNYLLGFLKALNNENIEETYFANSQLSYDISNSYQMRKTNIDNVRKLRSK